MLCLIPNIKEGVFKNPNGKHHIQLNNVIKTLYAVSSEKVLYEIPGTFWSEYKKFNHNNDIFDIN